MPENGPIAAAGIFGVNLQTGQVVQYVPPYVIPVGDASTNTEAPAPAKEKKA